MGSWFSSPAGYVTISKESAASFRELMDEIDALHAQEPVAGLSDDATSIRDLAYRSLQHYNSNHPGGEFRFTNQRSRHAGRSLSLVYPPTKDMKAACVGFRRDLWYHLNFLARPRPSDSEEDDQTFFAELRFDSGADDLIVETCTTLEKPPFRSSCAMCPDESQILHPPEFMCGKEGQQSEFFRERCAWDGDRKEIISFSRRDMLRLPFLLGGRMPRYRLVDSP